MSEKQPKLKFEEDKECTATRSPPKKSKVEQSKENFCGMTIKGMVYDDKKAAGERLLLARQEMPNADIHKQRQLSDWENCRCLFLRISWLN